MVKDKAGVLVPVAAVWDAVAEAADAAWAKQGHKAAGRD